jgi:peptidoglycan hydrolase-like protein with peptidoglycan-binding domain
MEIKLKRPVAANGAADEFDVRQLKKALNQLGYYQPFEKTGITGIADREVFEALKKFQQDQGLPVTGTARPDERTEQILNEEISKTPGGYYIWRTVEDGKVRAAHAKYNRTIRAWADSPDPGEDFNCRCWAEPIDKKVAEINDPSLRPVYPEFILIPLLRSGRIISVSRKIFEEGKDKWDRRIQLEREQLQKKFKHAEEFGIFGNPNNKKLEEFKKALQNHINSKETEVIKGTYHKEKVIHYFNPRTQINVMRDANGKFKSAWKLSEKQIKYLTQDGKLGGN